MTNLALRRFAITANRRYFDGKIDIAHVSFQRMPKSYSGRTRFPVYGVYRGSKRIRELERIHIYINSRLRSHGDLCKMTVFHELVHAELDSLGFRGKANSCHKGAVQFNKRMTELAQVGAFNGLW